MDRVRIRYSSAKCIEAIPRLTKLCAPLQVCQMKKVLSRVCVVGFATLMTTACGSIIKPACSCRRRPTAVNNPPPAVSGRRASVDAVARRDVGVGERHADVAGPERRAATSTTRSRVRRPRRSRVRSRDQCGGGLTISGSATGTLNGTAVTLTATGTASMPGIPNCPFTLTGNGTVEDNGNTLRMPFTGQTCLGPVSGTEVMRRPQPAAAPTISEPSPVSPSPNQILSGVRTTFVVANASHSGPVGALDYTFEVATDEGFTNRSEVGMFTSSRIRPRSLCRKTSRTPASTTGTSAPTTARQRVRGRGRSHSARRTRQRRRRRPGTRRLAAARPTRKSWWNASTTTSIPRERSRARSR